MSHFIGNPPVHTIGSFLFLFFFIPFFFHSFFILFSILIHNHEVSIPSEHFISEKLYLIFKIYLVFEISKIYLRQMYCCAAGHGVPKTRGWISNWTTTATCNNYLLVSIKMSILIYTMHGLLYHVLATELFFFFDLFSRSNHWVT